MGRIVDEEGEEGEEGQGKECIDQLELTLNQDITLDQPALLAIYTCVHLAWKSKGTRWNEVEIKDMIGHALLELDDDKYQKFELKDLIKLFGDRNEFITKAMEIRATKIKNVLLQQISKLQDKSVSYLSLMILCQLTKI